MLLPPVPFAMFVLGEGGGPLEAVGSLKDQSFDDTGDGGDEGAELPGA